MKFSFLNLASLLLRKNSFFLDSPRAHSAGIVKGIINCIVRWHLAFFLSIIKQSFTVVMQNEESHEGTTSQHTILAFYNENFKEKRVSFTMNQLTVILVFFPFLLCLSHQLHDAVFPFLLFTRKIYFPLW